MARPHATPPVIRSRLVLEVASELMGRRGIPAQARVELLNQGMSRPELCLFGSNAPSVIPEVARGDVQLAIVNPSTILTLAHRGTGPFSGALPVRTITVLPSHDQFIFALAERTGLASLQDVRDRRYPLRVSVRAQPDHGGHVLTDAVLAAHGFSMDDIVSWGGDVRRHATIPTAEPAAVDAGMRIVNLDEPTLQHLEAMGFRRARVSRSQYPALSREVDVTTLDFSGWAVFTSADAPDDLVTMICEALETRRDRIPWEGDGPLPLDRMCIDAEEAPLPAPLHPAAERFWRERGYLR